MCQFHPHHIFNRTSHTSIVFDAIRDAASAIESMRIRGAGKIARAAASAMKDFSMNYPGRTLDDFKRDAGMAKDMLMASRPTAVSLYNGIQSCVKDIGKVDTLEEARDSVSCNADTFVGASLKAVEVIAEIGAKRIEDGDIIMTHCNSSAALAVIKKAHGQGKDIKVFATESRPWRQGLLTVNDLAKEGIDVTLIIDSAVRMVMNKVDAVFVGADTITSHGVLVNKVGTSQLALAADEARVAFSVCSETYKFSPFTLAGDMVKIEERDHNEVARPEEIDPGVKIFNPVFDVTPPKYIDAYITEVGLLSPGSIYDVMIRQFGNDITGGMR